MITIDVWDIGGPVPGEKTVIRDDYGEVEIPDDSYVRDYPNLYQYTGTCRVNGELIHYYKFKG